MENRLSGTDVAFDPVDEEDNAPSAYLTQNTNPYLFLKLRIQKMIIQKNLPRRLVNWMREVVILYLRDSYLKINQLLMSYQKNTKYLKKEFVKSKKSHLPL